MDIAVFKIGFYLLIGKIIRKPFSETLLPKLDFIRWHRRQVFRPPIRD